MRHGIGGVARLVAMGLILIASTGAAHAAVYWIGPDGDDAADGSSSHPWKTVQKALGAAADGDTVLMLAGDYTFPRPSPKNRDRDYLTFKPAAGSEGKVRFVNGGWIRPYDNCDYLRFENVKFECGLYFTKVKHFQLRACTIDSTKDGKDAVLVSGEDILVEGCEAIGGSIGIAAAGKGVVVRYNHLHHQTSDGLRTSGENILIEGNYLHDNNPVKGAHPDHIQFFGGFPTNVRKIVIRGNYFDTKGQGIFGGAIDSKDGAVKGVCEDVLVENNVVVNSHLRCWSMTTTNNVVCRNNLFGFLPEQLADGGKPMGGAALIYLHNWGGGSYVFANNICRHLSAPESDKLTVANNLLIEQKAVGTAGLGPVALDQIFAGYLNHDYSIKAGAPTIDAGDAANAPETDILGRPRGEKPDIGPVEYSADDTKPLLEQFTALLKQRQDAIRESTLYKDAARAASPAGDKKEAEPTTAETATGAGS